MSELPDGQEKAAGGGVSFGMMFIALVCVGLDGAVLAPGVDAGRPDCPDGGHFDRALAGVRPVRRSGPVDGQALPPAGLGARGHARRGCQLASRTLQRDLLRASGDRSDRRKLRQRHRDVRRPARA